MRSIPESVQTALDNQNGIKLNARITTYNSRVFVGSTNLDDDYSMPGALTAGINEDNVVFQDCHFDPTNEAVVTIAVTATGFNLAMEGVEGVTSIENSCASLTRPTLIPPYIFYQDADGALIRDAYEYSEGAFTITDSETIAESTDHSGSLFGLDSDNAMFLYIDDGGVGVTHFERQEDDSWTENVWAGRIMFPDQIWDESNLRRLNYAAAAKTNNGIFIYLSMPTGSVSGVQLLGNGNWSDTFVAFPQDLSKFFISNCIVGSGQRIHLCGQFIRTDNWDSGKVYNLVLWSDDGQVFSVDRNTIFSNMGYRFMVSLGRDSVIFSDMNRTAVCDSIYSFYGEDAERTQILKSISISGSQATGWNISLGNGDSKYTNNSLLQRGNHVKLEFGVMVNGSVNWVHYDTAVISKIEKIELNGMRTIELTIISEGLWKASSTTYPFGMEIQSKQSIRDDVSEMDNLSTAPDSHGIRDPFCVPLSSVENPFGAQGKPADGGIFTWMSGNLISKFYFEEYPEITEFPLTIKLYGWSRIGPDDENPNLPDTTNASDINDTFNPVFVVEDSNGEERTVTIADSYAVDGINYPPQTWKPGSSRADGHYPVEYYVDADCGLQIGDRIKEVGIRVYSPHATLYYLERVEIPELPMYMIGTFYGGTLGEESDWNVIYTPTPYTPPSLPPLIFPPIVFPPLPQIPVTPPVIEACGSSPIEAVQINESMFTLIGTKTAGTSHIIPCTCRLRANSNDNPSRMIIEGRWEEEGTVYDSSELRTKFLPTDRTDFYRVEALNYDYEVVATAYLGTALLPENPSDPLCKERRSGIFDNTEEVNVSFLRFVVDKAVEAEGRFTATEDPWSTPLTPFRPTSVIHDDTYNNIGGQFAWRNRGTITWGETPGGIWIKDVGQECNSSQGNDLIGWVPMMLQQYRMSGGGNEQYASSKVFEVTVTQHKYMANGYGPLPNYDYQASDFSTPVNAYGEVVSGYCFNRYEWRFGGGYNPTKLAGYEPNSSDPFTFSSAINGIGNTVVSDVVGLWLSRHISTWTVGGSQTVTRGLTWVCDSETLIYIKYPGFEHNAIPGDPTKLTVVIAEIENVCGLEL